MVHERRCEACMSMGIFWPDCQDPNCPLTQGTEGYMVNGKTPEMWSFAGLLHRERLLCLALRPLLGVMNHNHTHMNDDSMLTIKVSVGDLRFALRVAGEDYLKEIEAEQASLRG